MHPDIAKKLQTMRDEKQFNRAEYRVTRDMHRGAKAIAAITQPIIETITRERDEAIAMVDTLKNRIDEVFGVCPMERCFAMASDMPALYVETHLNALTHERDEARAQLATAETERDHWRNDCDALRTRLDEVEAELAALKAEKPDEEQDDGGWLPSTGKCPDVERADLKFRDGSVVLNVCPAYYFSWSECGEFTITHWRPTRGVR